MSTEKCIGYSHRAVMEGNSNYFRYLVRVWALVQRDLLAWLGLKARFLAWLFLASGLRYSRPGPAFVASSGFGFSWPASPGFICFWPGWLTSHSPYVRTSISRYIWLYIRQGDYTIGGGKRWWALGLTQTYFLFVCLGTAFRYVYQCCILAVQYLI